MPTNTQMKWRWLRVNRGAKCVVCDKADWCTFCPELNLACCMRIASDRPCKNESGGYLHPLNGQFKKMEFAREDTPPPPSIDAARIMAEFSNDTKETELARLAASLGVSTESLRAIGCQRAVPYRAWAFPMHGGNGEIIGIRLRGDDGSKYAVTGSRQGIFMMNQPPSPTAYIVEGASDLAALRTIGLFGIGRPSCCGCISTITAALSMLGVRRAVIITDVDPHGQGLKGAESLQAELDIPSVIYVPPTKDLREAVGLGLTASLIESVVSSQVWTVPKSRRSSYSVNTRTQNQMIYETQTN